MDRGAWQAAVYGCKESDMTRATYHACKTRGSVVRKSACQRRRHRDVVTPLGRENPLEEVMATHCSILACRILWTEESCGLQSMGLQGIRHD